jgi:CHAT domain-containing protein
MTVLYRGLKSDQRSSLALARAKRQLIADGQPPFVWAPFVLIGR